MQSSMRALYALWVLCLALCALGAAGALEGSSAVAGRRRLQGFALRDLLQAKAAPCHHTATTQQPLTASSTLPKQAPAAVVKGSSPIRQLLQAPAPKAKRPATPLSPAQRQGFATGRRAGVNAVQVQRPPARPAPTAG